MRYAIFSDTHANLPALEAVLKRLDKEKVDEMVCLGDTVGYGSQPNECCDLVRENCKHTILGNHDAAVAGRMDYSYYYDAAREALDLHSKIVSETNMEWLKELPYKIEENDEVHFCHGSPVDIEEFEYIFSVEQAATCIPDLGASSGAGDLHRPLAPVQGLRDRQRAGLRGRDPRVRGPPASTATSSRWARVGQPRDHDPRASYTILDTGRGTFEFKRVEYDVNVAAQRIFDYEGLSDSFGARLFAGV